MRYAAARINPESYAQSIPKHFAKIMLSFGPNNEAQSVFKPPARSNFVHTAKQAFPGVPVTQFANVM